MNETNNPNQAALGGGVKFHGLRMMFCGEYWVMPVMAALRPIQEDGQHKLPLAEYLDTNAAAKFTAEQAAEWEAAGQLKIN